MTEQRPDSDTLKAFNESIVDEFRANPRRKRDAGDQAAIDPERILDRSWLGGNSRRLDAEDRAGGLVGQRVDEAVRPRLHFANTLPRSRPWSLSVS